MLLIKKFTLHLKHKLLKTKYYERRIKASAKENDYCNRMLVIWMDWSPSNDDGLPEMVVTFIVVILFWNRLDLGSY